MSQDKTAKASPSANAPQIGALKGQSAAYKAILLYIHSARSNSLVSLLKNVCVSCYISWRRFRYVQGIHEQILAVLCEAIELQPTSPLHDWMSVKAVIQAGI